MVWEVEVVVVEGGKQIGFEAQQNRKALREKGVVTFHQTQPHRWAPACLTPSLHSHWEPRSRTAAQIYLLPPPQCSVHVSVSACVCLNASVILMSHVLRLSPVLPASLSRSLSLYCTTSLSAFVLKWVICELFSAVCSSRCKQPARFVHIQTSEALFRRGVFTSSLNDLIAGGQLFSTGVNACKMHSGQ